MRISAVDIIAVAIHIRIDADGVVADSGTAKRGVRSAAGDISIRSDVDIDVDGIVAGGGRSRGIRKRAGDMARCRRIDVEGVAVGGQVIQKPVRCTAVAVHIGRCRGRNGNGVLRKRGKR